MKKVASAVSNEQLATRQSRREDIVQIVYEAEAPWDLKMISWPPGVRRLDLKSYAYGDDTSGGSSIFLVEDGVNVAHPVRSFSYLASGISAYRGSSNKHSRTSHLE